MTTHRGDESPQGHPPTAVQCALALVTAGLAVAAVMLALVGTAQAGYVDTPPEDETYPQSLDSTASQVQSAPTFPPLVTEAACPLPVPATYSGTVRVDGQPAADDITLTARINGEAWATANISDGRYAIGIPQDPPEAPPCFPGSGTIVFTLDGYVCMPAEEDEGKRWVACGYRSFTPGLHEVDLLCLPAPPSLPPADDTIGTAALLVTELGEPPETAAAYRELWHAQPEASWAARAAFLSGLIPYQAGDAETAKEAWEEMLDAFPSPEDRAQAHLWLAKIDLAFSNDREGASAHLQQAVAAAPYSLYALRAEAYLEAQAAAPLPWLEDTIEAPAAPDWGAVEGWLTSLWGPETAADGSLPFDLTAWQRGQELHQSGLDREATNVFLQLINESNYQPWGLYRLARAFDDLAIPHLAARAATHLLAKAGGPLEQTPRALLELAYPLAYPSLIQTVAAENGLSPLLLLALIRQESFFDPLAVSPAGALGLTQVMPSTADGIAGSLDLEGFSTSDLLRPQVSIEFGAHYLGSQLDVFGGNPYLALAAYNAGPDQAARWSAGVLGSDMDLFVELIDFAETRSYVKAVLEQYAVYRFLYGGADHPTLLTNPRS